MHWNMAEPVNISDGIIVRLPRRSETHSIAEGAVRRVKKGLLLSCCRPGSMNYRGQILCSVTAICAMLKTSCETGKLHRIGDMENHSVGHFFLSDRRLNIIRYLQKVRRTFSWETRSSQASPRAAPGVPEESGKETSSLQTLRNYTTLTRQKYTLRDSTHKMFSCRNKKTILHSLAQMVQQSWQVKGAAVYIYHEVRTSDQSRGHSGHGEGHRSAHQGEADDPPLQNSKKYNMTWKPGTRSGVFWEFLFPSSRSTRSKVLCAERKVIPNPAQKIDVVKRTNTTLDVLQESQIDDFWSVDGDRELSRHAVLIEKPYTWTRWRSTNIQATSRPEYIWPEVWTNASKITAKKKTASGDREAEARQYSKAEGN